MEPRCETCPIRAKYDANQSSLLGRLWKWHTGWCPGWNRYMKSLPDEKRTDLAKKYNMKKFMPNPSN